MRLRLHLRPIKYLLHRYRLERIDAPLQTPDGFSNIGDVSLETVETISVQDGAS